MKNKIIATLGIYLLLGLFVGANAFTTGKPLSEQANTLDNVKIVNELLTLDGDQVNLTGLSLSPGYTTDSLMFLSTETQLFKNNNYNAAFTTFSEIVSLDGKRLNSF